MQLNAYKAISKGARQLKGIIGIFTPRKRSGGANKNYDIKIHLLKNPNIAKVNIPT
jgi:hypothetical protein